VGWPVSLVAVATTYAYALYIGIIYLWIAHRHEYRWYPTLKPQLAVAIWVLPPVFMVCVDWLSRRVPGIVLPVARHVVCGMGGATYVASVALHILIVVI
jgi:hypothetical protein